MKSDPSSYRYKRRALLCLSTGGHDEHTKPWWMNTCVFGIATVCFLTIPYRLYFFYRTQKLTWKVLRMQAYAQR